MPKPLRQVMASTMKPDFETVDCILDRDASTETNANVDQSHIVLPSMDRFLETSMDILFAAMQGKGLPAEDEEGNQFDGQYKIVVFLAYLCYHRETSLPLTCFERGLQGLKSCLR